MASVDWAKCKAGTGRAGALLRHCDAQERLQHEHSNEHIDKGRTPGNRQGALSYEQTMAAMQRRLSKLDAMEGANRRKDRVELLMLGVPIPHGYDPLKFTKIAIREIGAVVGPENILNWYLHVDEVHEYMDRGKLRESLEHLHVAVMPVVDDRLNAKALVTRARMIELNNRIDRSARRELGGPGFLTGEEPRRRTVEHLKAASYEQALQAHKEAVLDANEAGVEKYTLEREIASMAQEKASLGAEIEAQRGELEKLATKSAELQQQLDAKQAIIDQMDAAVRERSAKNAAARRAAERLKGEIIKGTDYHGR